jgi:hypothetical protein
MRKAAFGSSLGRAARPTVRGATGNTPKLVPGPKQAGATLNGGRRLAGAGNKAAAMPASGAVAAAAVGGKRKRDEAAASTTSAAPPVKRAAPVARSSKPCVPLRRARPPTRAF